MDRELGWSTTLYFFIALQCVVYKKQGREEGEEETVVECPYLIAVWIRF